ncbi:hypothetical protein QBC34DRAFT_89322 [Podospora aff. communis PSN243]|uniref:Uncharacterized protein n=1 Tax=Podospora aff. communis PSN243 TaxID=3040156 RepID=A0AAV9GKP5_9PEZI|nr:hypothetical protein QBC34DRAFT_89322 [Podospora aff. communis PSN243]
MPVELSTPQSSSSASQEPAKSAQDEGQGWAVDMSGAANDSNDDDARGAGDGRDSEEEHSESPLKSLNPWSIAALAASRRGQLLHIPRCTFEERRARSLSTSSSTDMDDSLSDSERAPPSRYLPPGHNRRHSSVERSPNRPAASVPGGPYRRPLPATGASVVRKQRTAGFRGQGSLQGKRQSSRPLPDSSWHQKRQALPLESGQTRLSFRNQEVQRQRRSENRQYDQPGNSSYPRLPVASRADDMKRREKHAYYEVTESHARQPYRGELCPHAVLDSPQHRPPHTDDVLGAAVLSDEVQIKELPETSLSVEDRRAYLIKRQRSIARNPAKKHRRLQTDLLPLEVIPRGAETRSLALTFKVDTSRLSGKVLSRGILVEDEAINPDLKSDLESGRLASIEREIITLLSQLGIGDSCLKLKPLGPLRELPPQ